MFKHFNWFFLVICLFFSLWQFSRYREKHKMVLLAEERLQRTLNLNDTAHDLFDNLQEFNLVKGTAPEVGETFHIRRKIGDKMLFKKYLLFPYDDSRLVLIGLGCSEEGSNPEITGTWVALKTPSYNSLFVNLVNMLIPPDEIPFLDKGLLAKRRVVGQQEIADLYLEPVKDNFSVQDLFAFDFSRSEIFFGLRKVENPDDSICFKAIAPPSLHLSYVFEWIFIGVVGFLLLTLIKRKFYFS